MIQKFKFNKVYIKFFLVDIIANLSQDYLNILVLRI
jgi:hypothetical protein